MIIYWKVNSSFKNQVTISLNKEKILMNKLLPIAVLIKKLLEIEFKKEVTFTDSSGYPYLDENNRTMVPLRVTMESAGFVVGYDENLRTAIVITEHNRIEVPIGTNKIYTECRIYC